MLKVAPSRIASILDLKTKEVEEVIYFVSYIVLDAGETKYLKKGTVLDLGSAKVSLKSREQLLKTLEDVKLKVEEGTIYEKKVNRMLDQLREPNVPFSVEEV